ncbi:integrase core domain-containing protein [Nitrosomonas sp. Nm84]|uniref:integrase core domain-containing protein n=1 Tax=Nitrosomonas sp. Nm84 TaxID=200124 RepID=UPI000D76925C|nr:integrase core domain-containing protein [Nitrosomonas sp. Nm84]
MSYPERTRTIVICFEDRSGLANSDSRISGNFAQLKPCNRRQKKSESMRRTRRNHAAGFKAKVACDAKQDLEKYFMFYNQNRPHAAVDDKTPNEFYFDNLPVMQKAG